MYNNGQGQEGKIDTVDTPLCSNQICNARGKGYYIGICDMSNTETTTTLPYESHKIEKERPNNVNHGEYNTARVPFTSSDPTAQYLEPDFVKASWRPIS